MVVASIQHVFRVLSGGGGPFRANPVGQGVHPLNSRKGTR